MKIIWKEKEKERPSKKSKIDYASIERPFPGGPNYYDLVLVCPSSPNQPHFSHFESPSITFKNLFLTFLHSTSVVNFRSTNLSMHLHISPFLKLRRVSKKITAKEAV
jgi:hypothetical protein